MLTDLDPRAPEPLYLQLVTQLKRLIAVGALRPGERLPTVRELAGHSRLNRNTTARAIQQLESEGWVWTRVGQGTFVADDAPALAAAAHSTQLDEALDRVLELAAASGVSLHALSVRLRTRSQQHERRNHTLEETTR